MNKILRSKEMLDLLDSGVSVKDIAEKYSIQVQTVKNCIREYEEHLNKCNNSEVYKLLFNATKVCGDEVIIKGVFTRTINLINRHNISSIELLSNEMLNTRSVFYNKLGIKGRELVNFAINNLAELREENTEIIVSTYSQDTIYQISKRSRVSLNQEKISELTGIPLDAIDGYVNKGHSLSSKHLYAINTANKGITNGLDTITRVLMNRISGKLNDSAEYTKFITELTNANKSDTESVIKYLFRVYLD